MSKKSKSCMPTTAEEIEACEKVKKARKELLHMTQQELAKVLGYTANYIAQVETKKKKASIAYIETLVEHFENLRPFFIPELYGYYDINLEKPIHKMYEELDSEKQAHVDEIIKFYWHQSHDAKDPDEYLRELSCDYIVLQTKLSEYFANEVEKNKVIDNTDSAGNNALSGNSESDANAASD